jgi:ubiquitin-protein ligase E3 C
MAAYILTRGFYSGLASAMRSIVGIITLSPIISLCSQNLISHQPTDSRASASLPPIVTLLASPFLIFPPSSPLYNFALDELIHHILSLPLLPNRLPLASLTYFSSRIPLSSIFTYRSPGSAAGGNNFAHLVNSITSLDARIHLLANLLAFIPVRIPKFNAAEVDGYLSLCTTILDSLPIGSLENNTVNALPIWQQIQEDVDSDAETSGVPHTSRPAKAAALDGKTQSRLQTLHQHAYINTLLTATSRHSTTRPRLFSYMISLWTVWPSRKERILNSLVAGNAGFGLIKEVWRGWIRRSSLGKEEDPGKAIEILTCQSISTELAFFMTCAHSITLTYS